MCAKCHHSCPLRQSPQHMDQTIYTCNGSCKLYGELETLVAQLHSPNLRSPLYPSQLYYSACMLPKDVQMGETHWDRALTIFTSLPVMAVPPRWKHAGFWSWSCRSWVVWKSLESLGARCRHCNIDERSIGETWESESEIRQHKFWVHIMLIDHKGSGPSGECFASKGTSGDTWHTSLWRLSTEWRVDCSIYHLLLFEQLLSYLLIYLFGLWVNGHLSHL